MQRLNRRFSARIRQGVHRKLRLRIWRTDRSGRGGVIPHSVAVRVLLAFYLLAHNATLTFGEGRVSQRAFAGQQ
jgi:hypothetical protein